MPKKPEPEPKAKDRKRGLSLFARFEVSQEQDQFLESFAMLVGSGMDVLVALEATKTESRTPAMRRVIDQIILDIDAGQPIWEAFDNVGFLRPHTISLIRIGEEAGRLSENLQVVSIQRQKEKTFRSKLISALLYPGLVFGVTIIVGVAISWFVLPRLATVFSQLNVELPLITRGIIWLGEFLGDYGIYAVPGVIVAVVTVFYLLFINDRTKIAGERLMILFGPIRRVLLEIEMARLGYVLGTLLEAGLPIVDALQSIVDATPAMTYRRLYEHLKTSVDQGNSFRKSFASFSHIDRLMPVPIQQLVSSAEQSGTLAKALIEIGQRYEEKTDVTTKNLVVILEPILLVVVWLGVVAVAVAVILPIYTLVGDFDASGAASAVPPVEAPKESTDPAGQTLGATIGELWILTNSSEVAVPVYDRPSLSGQAVGEIFQGDSQVSHERSGNWYRTELGWVDGSNIDVLTPETVSDFKVVE